MKEGRYLSRKENRYCWIYENWKDAKHYVCECDICKKLTKHPISLMWEDDEQNLEWSYGSDCIKDLKLKYAEIQEEGQQQNDEAITSKTLKEQELKLVDNRLNAILGKGDDYGFDEYDLIER